MKSLLDKYKSRLTATEKEEIWRNLPGTAGLEARRRTQFWTRMTTTSGAVLAVVLLAIFYDWNPNQLDRFDKLALEGQPEMEIVAGPEALDEAIEKTVATADERAVIAARGVPDRMELPEAAPSEIVTLKKAADGGGKALALSFDDQKIAAAPEAPKSESTVTASNRASRGPAASGDVRAEAKSAPEAGGATTMSSGVNGAAAGTRAGARSGVPGTVRGRVVDADTGEPIAFANVVVVGTQFGAMTLEDGSFSFVLPSGEYHLIITYIGYEAYRTGPIEVVGEETVELRFVLAPGAALDMETVVAEVEGPRSSGGRGEKGEKRSALRKIADKFGLGAAATGDATSVPQSAGEILGRGGRSGETLTMVDGVRSAEDAVRQGRERSDLNERLKRRRCWIPEGWNPPNGEAYDTMFFEDYGVNPFLFPDEDALSTFAVDVDNASYTIARRYLEDGNLPPKGAIRVEEFVNFFEADYPPVTTGDFGIHTDLAPSPFGSGYHLLRVGVQGRAVPESRRLPANLIFVIDTSGSMDRENRLGLVKRSLHILLDELRGSDTVGIVEYGSQGRVVLRPTSLEDRREIERAIDSLHPNGSTNCEEGLDIGYTMASRMLDEKSINRLILCSDGVANTGETQAEKILDKVRYESDRGIYLTTVGFGMGNYNDVLMEKLANQGDGNYFYVDRIEEAERVFGENLASTLQTIARDVKIQVEFNLEAVSRYRLLGYENRDVADEDFRNDSVDAGEVGAGHQVTALYEIKLVETPSGSRRASRSDNLGRIATVRLRYELPESAERGKAGTVEEIAHQVSGADLVSSFDRARPDFRLAAIAAEFAEILKESFWARGSELRVLLRDAEAVGADFRRDDSARELIELIGTAARIADGDDGYRDRRERPSRR